VTRTVLLAAGGGRGVALEELEAVVGFDACGGGGVEQAVDGLELAEWGVASLLQASRLAEVVSLRLDVPQTAVVAEAVGAVCQCKQLLLFIAHSAHPSLLLHCIAYIIWAPLVACVIGGWWMGSMEWGVGSMEWVWGLMDGWDIKGCIYHWSSM
jgi:hypothetical protein